MEKSASKLPCLWPTNTNYHSPYPSTNGREDLHELSLLSTHRLNSLNLANLSAFEEEEPAKKKGEVKPDHVLGAIEEAYPNSLTIDDMSRRFALSQDSITKMVMDLVDRNLVKAVGAGGSADGSVDPFAAGFRRVHQGGRLIDGMKMLIFTQIANTHKLKCMTHFHCIFRTKKMSLSCGKCRELRGRYSRR